MAYKDKYVFSDHEQAAMLSDALHQWNPALPRRWLYRYGHLYQDARRSPLYEDYCVLRAQALMMTRKEPSHYAQSWPAEGFYLALNRRQ